jgi:alpha-glucuronidase
MKYLTRLALVLIFILSAKLLSADDGYRLWLRYDVVSDKAVLDQYNKSVSGWIIEGESPVLNSCKNEMQLGLNGLLGRDVPVVNSVKKNGIIIAGTPASSPLIASMKLNEKLSSLGTEGYLIISTKYRKE